MGFGIGTKAAEVLGMRQHRGACVESFSASLKCRE